MCKTVINEDFNPEETKTGEGIKAVKGDVKEPGQSADATKGTTKEKKAEDLSGESALAIGHVPLPGSGTGKGTVVKKIQAK